MALADVPRGEGGELDVAVAVEALDGVAQANEAVLFEVFDIHLTRQGRLSRRAVLTTNGL